MNKFKSILILAFLCVLNSSNSQNKTYLDVNGNVTTKGNAKSEREARKIEVGKWLIADYDVNTGQPLFVFYTKDSLATVYHGEAIRYTNSSKVLERKLYKNGICIGSYVAHKSALGSKETGWDEDDVRHFVPDLSEKAVAATNTANITNTYYYKTTTLARQYFDYSHNKNEQSYTLFFDKKRDTIARLNYNENNEKWNGKDISFYITEYSGNDNIISIKEINTYREGIMTSKKFYLNETKLIADGRLKNGKPFNGTFLLDDWCRYIKLQDYKEGILKNEISYNIYFEEIGRLKYKNKQPYTGVYFDCSGVENFKQGKLHGSSVQFFDSETGVIETKYNYNKGVKDGEYKVYANRLELAEKGTYNHGVLINDVYYYTDGIPLDYDDEMYEGEDEVDNFSSNKYYLKINVKEAKHKLVTSKIDYFNSKSEALIATFQLTENKFDAFAYLKSGHHLLSQPDLNKDGKNDLVIYNNNYSLQSYSYYLFSDKTQSYMFLSEFNEEKQVEITQSNDEVIVRFKSILSEYDDEIEDTENVQYAINEIVFNTDLEKLLETETLEHYFSSVTTVTQIFPESIQKYPLLNEQLPPIVFSQKGKEFPVLEKNQTIILKKSPFSITFPGQLDTQPFTQLGLGSIAIASYDKSKIETTIEGLQIEAIDDFNGLWTANSSVDHLNNEFVISEMGHNDLFYNPEHETLVKKVKNINDDVLSLQLNIDHFTIQFKNEVINVEDISAPIYLVFFTDKNRNLRVDKNEYHYITLEFE